ncbi:MAG: XkdX family protein [Oscillospiraceae bacterium]|nr:XkdX family protein [Oscillospiraceae bacterium]
MLSEPAPASTLSARKARSVGDAHSPAFARVKRNYDRGLWGASMLSLAVEKGHITEAEGLEILEAE